ncbi:MAG: flagellar motor protein MotB [Rhodospirillaceae bacterium]|jgi:chemotaxis protein MotB|nr:flagellar motor protein MotB [Rhodospirillaceae bacterium]
MADEGGDGGGNGAGALGGAVFIKRVKKVEGGAHGGAWKIAYADFVTAMMAFFLLLWLLNSVTQEQLEGISNYFAPASVSATTSGAGGILGGQTMSEEGSEVSAKAKPTVSLALPPPKTGLGGESSADTPPPKSEEEATQEQVKKAEEKQFDEAKKELEDALSKSAAMEALKKSLLVDNTVEGLRIQIVDQEGLPLFRSGSADPLDRAVELLKLVKSVVDKLTQKISISGHTDAVKFGSGAQYTNWELSVDRANSARRILLELGLEEDRLSRVVGKASTELLLKDKPKDAQNRRLSIVMLRGTGAKPDVGADSNPDAIIKNKDDAENVGTPKSPAPTETPSGSTAPLPPPPASGNEGSSGNGQPPVSGSGNSLPPPPLGGSNGNKGGLRGLILRR